MPEEVVHALVCQMRPLRFADQQLVRIQDNTLHAFKLQDFSLSSLNADLYPNPRKHRIGSNSMAVFVLGKSYIIAMCELQQPFHSPSILFLPYSNNAAQM